MTHTILAINPGSTSTKIAVFDNETLRYQTTLMHSNEELDKYLTVADQFSFRREAVVADLQKNGVELSEISAVIGRGGLVQPIESGIYEVNELMKQHLRTPTYGEHASNLGAFIAEDIAHQIGGEVRAYIADPVVVDEMMDVARVSGHPKFERLSIFHALNQKAIARTYAQENSKKYEELNLIVVHMGGGISIGAHQKGRVVDVNNALDGDGPMSPERSGTLPVGQLIKLCFSGKYTQKEMAQMAKGKGGLVGFTGSNDARGVRERAVQGDQNAQKTLDAMYYQIAKSTGAAAVTLQGKVDAILLTGGMAHSPLVTDAIAQQVDWIAPVKVYPGEDEMGALAQNALKVLTGELKPKTYEGCKK